MSDVRPILIGAGNAKDATGVEWSWWRRNAKALGIEIVRVGAKSFARASDVLAAIERQSVEKTPLAPIDELAEFRARIARAG